MLSPVLSHQSISLSRSIGQPDARHRKLRIAREAAEYGAAQLVVGLPRNMDGTEGESARSAREFGAALAERTGLPVDFCDERGTTITAHEYLNATDTRGKRRKAVVDAVAATVILENYLAARRSRRAREGEA